MKLKHVAIGIIGGTALGLVLHYFIGGKFLGGSLLTFVGVGIGSALAGVRAATRLKREQGELR